MYLRIVPPSSFLCLQKSKVGFFERYLTLWVLVCMALGILIGEYLESIVEKVSHWEIASLNIPVVALVWCMIYPMMVQIDFGALRSAAQNWRGLGLTVFINWCVKPFTMALWAWLFFNHVWAPWLPPKEAQEYVAGAVLLGAAPCTAMVFMWSYLSGGNPAYTVVQVAVNDLILLVAFVPIVQILLGLSAIPVPYDLLFLSVLLFVGIPLLAGFASRNWLLKRLGEEKFKSRFLPALKPFSILALLLTLILIFAFQGHYIITRPFSILMITVPLIVQTYIIFFVSWLLGRKLGLRYGVCAPASMIGASNFFELAVAVAIALFGLQSGATLTTVVGVLIEVPVMLSLVGIAKKMKY